jgi:hypothetical protein
MFIKFFVTQFLLFIVPRVQRLFASSLPRRVRSTQLPLETISEFEAGVAPRPHQHHRCFHDVANPDDGYSLYETLGLLLQLAILSIATLYFVHFIGILQVTLGVPIKMVYEIISANTGRDALRRQIHHLKSVCILGLATTIVHVLVQTYVVQLDDIEAEILHSVYKFIMEIVNTFTTSNHTHFE